MAVSITSVTCPACGAALPIQEGRTQVYCSYCGTKVLVNDKNETVYRHFDDADIKRAETSRIIQLKKLELEEKNRISKKASVIAWGVVSAILFIISILMMRDPDNALFGIIGILVFIYAFLPSLIGGAILLFVVRPRREANNALLLQGGIRFPKGFEPFINTDYETLLYALQNVGFDNIHCVCLHDCSSISYDSGKIAYVTVGGERIRKGGRIFLPNTPILITYHGK